MRVLVACEFSGRVRDAFTARGHYAASVDLLPSQTPGPHYQGDIRDYLTPEWDLLLAFPPCTYVCSSGLHWNKRRPGRELLTLEAIEFARTLLNAPIKRKAMENPIGRLSTAIRKPDQIVQPWMFGDDASKATCLWLDELPPLIPTNIISKARYANQTASGQNKLGRSPDRAMLRSITYPGIAAAMADQWGALL